MASINLARRLAVGLVLLLIVCFAAAAPASAHAGPQVDAAASQAASANPFAFLAPGHGLPCPQNDACPLCCGMGECAMFSATLADGPAISPLAPLRATPYGGGIARPMMGVGSAPDTEPPRLAA